MGIRQVGGNVFLVLLSASLPILAVEGAFRIFPFDTSFEVGRELPWMRKTAGVFTVDPEFGFRPRLDSGVYNAQGTRVNSYSLSKSEGVERLLFIGDSVTFRARIIAALREQFGEKKYEYWNAGVESFNTVQEYKFLKEYNLKIEPDHVILSFHLNDYETTPVVFYEGNELRVYAPNSRLEGSHPWLLQNSYIYRTFLKVIAGTDEWENQEASNSIVEEVQEYLAKMQRLLREENIAFTVIVLPYFKPYKDWAPVLRQKREITLATLKELGIRHFDLLDLTEKAHQDGVNTQEKKGDTSHPGDEISAIYARHLYEEKIF